MANWHETINIAGLHRMYSSGAINLQQLSKGVARRLQNTHAFAISDPELMDIIFSLNSIDEFARLKDYNTAIDWLYEWGDKEYGKGEYRMWIEAEGVVPNEHDDVPAKTRNPLEEDTKPQYGRPHHHGPHTIIKKGPYSVQSGDEWVSHKFDVPKKTDEDIPYWEMSKVYKPGDIVRHKNGKFECLIGNFNVDPDANSKFKPGEPWKWTGGIQSKPFDPTLAFKDRLTCESKGKFYPTGRKHRYMSEDEFNKKLREHDIDPPTVPKELYSYWKDSEDKYQDWLIARWLNNNLTFREPTPEN